MFCKNGRIFESSLETPLPPKPSEKWEKGSLKGHQGSDGMVWAEAQMAWSALDGKRVLSVPETRGEIQIVTRGLRGAQALRSQKRVWHRDRRTWGGSDCSGWWKTPKFAVISVAFLHSFCLAGLQLKREKTKGVNRLRPGHLQVEDNN